MVQTIPADNGTQLFADRGTGAGVGEPGTNGDRGQTPGNPFGGKRIHAFTADARHDDTGGATDDAGNAERTKAPRPRRRNVAAANEVGDLIYEGLGALNGILEVARGPHWKIPDAKTRRVANAYAKVVEVYIPANKIGESSVILAAAFATLVAYGPPITVDTMKAMEAAAKFRAAQAAARAQRAAQQPVYNPAGASPGFMPPPYQSDPFGQPPPAPEPAVTGEVVPQYADGIPNDMLRAMGIDPDDPMVQAAMQTADQMMRGMFGAENAGGA